MMKDEIDQFSSHVPKSPIRELLELEPETAKASTVFYAAKVVDKMFFVGEVKEAHE
jgi:hypothetical protein